MKRREFLQVTTSCLLAGATTRRTEASPTDNRWAVAAKSGRAFLASLFDPTLNLLPEFPGASVYWLYHDNYLAARVLAEGRPDLSDRIQKAIHSYGFTRSGKIEIVLDEAESPLPFRHPELIEVKRIGDRIVKTEVLTDREFKGWEEYADLLLMASMALSKTDAGAAAQRLTQALAMWDGTGLKDRVTTKTGRYAVYKLALAVLAAHRLNQWPTTLNGILERLLKQQAECGGWITDYTADGKPVGLANVETTSLAVLAFDATVKQA